MVAPLDLPLWSCPECRMRGNSGLARLGNNRNLCVVCNRWATAVRRLTARDLASAHPDEAAAIRARVEADLFARLVQEWRLDHPGPAPSVQQAAALDPAPVL